MEITGLMVYYYFVCKRKLWYFRNDINMEQNSDLVELGQILHEDSYNREGKSILINNAINIDFINHKTILHEVKKSRSIEEAGIWQLKYYMYYLDKNGVRGLIGEIDYPLLREKKTIELTDADKEKLKSVEDEIKIIIHSDKPPEILNSKICKKCAYYDFCYV